MTRVRLNENQLRRMVRMIIAESTADTVVGNLDMKSFMEPYKNDFMASFKGSDPRFNWLKIPGISGEYNEVMRTVISKYGQEFEDYANAYLKLSGSLWNIMAKYFKSYENSAQGSTRLPKWVNQLSNWSGVSYGAVGPFEDKTNSKEINLESFKSLEVFVAEALSSHMKNVFIPLANKSKSDPDSVKKEIKDKTKEIEALRYSSGDLRNAESSLHGEAFLRSRGIL